MTQGGLLVVGNQQTSRLDFFDCDSLEKIGTMSGLVDQPHEIAWDSRRRLIYVAHTYRSGGYAEGKPKAHEISVIDPDRRQVVEVIDIGPFEAPHDVEFDPVSDRIYTGVERGAAGNGIVIINPETREVEGSIPVAGPNTHWLSLTPDGAKAYLCHKDGELFSVVDLYARRQIGSIPSPGGGEEVDCSADGRHAFAAAPMMRLAMNVAQGQLNKAPTPAGYPNPHLLKIDTATDQVVARLDFPDYLAAVRTVPDGRVLVSEFKFPAADAPAGSGSVNGHLYVVDGEKMELITAIEVDALPFTIRVLPDGSRAFVSNVMTGTVSVIDLRTYDVIARLENRYSGDLMAGTHGICFVPAI